MTVCAPSLIEIIDSTWASGTGIFPTNSIIGKFGVFIEPRRTLLDTLRKDLGLTGEASLFMVLLAGFLALLHRYNADSRDNAQAERMAVVNAEDLVVVLNGQRLSNARKTGEWLEFRLKPVSVRKGINRFTFTLKPDSRSRPTLDDLMLWVSY